MKRTLATFAIIVIISAVSSVSWAAERFYSKADPSLPGAISGTIRPADQAQQVVALEQVRNKTYLGTINRQTGSYIIKGIPPGKYDLITKMTEYVIEGIRLNVRPVRRGTPDEQLSQEDKKGIEEAVYRSEDYFNKKNILRLHGNKKHAKVIVEQIRDKRTFYPDGRVMKGLMIRRIDLYNMQKSGKVWLIKNNKHLYREERPIAGPGSAIKHKFDKTLGGIRVTRSESKGHNYSLSSME